MAAIRAHNMLANGMGGIDWSGLPLVAEFIGVRDVEGLLESLETVLTHRPAGDKSTDTED